MSGSAVSSPAPGAGEAAATAPAVAPLHPSWAAIGRAAAAGAFQGGLLYGAVISLLHLLHSRMQALDAVVVLAWSVLLYGAAGATLALLAAWGWRVLRRLRPRRAGAADERGATTLALAAFSLPFWLLTASYGLTYDESPAWVGGAPAMAAWLLLRSVAVGALVIALSWWPLAPLLGATVGQLRRRRWALSGALAGWLLLHLALALARPPQAPELPPPPARPPSSPPAARVALVGLDGADWRVIRPLVAAGRMPHLARLMREGAWGPLATLPDSNSAVIWASIYSGRDPDDHGVHDFYTLRLAGMGREAAGVYPVHRTFFKELVLRLQGLDLAEVLLIDRHRVVVPLLWEVVQAQGRSIGVVDGYLYSYPAPRLTTAGSYFLAYGADGLWRSAAERGLPPSRSAAARYATPPELISELGPRLAGPDFSWQSAALLELLARRGQPDLVSLYTHEPDSVQHASWRYLEPRYYFGVDRHTVAARDRIVPFHLALDRFLGALRRRLAPDTVLVLVSDHGHSPTLLHEMDTQHRHGPPGILLLHGPAVRAGAIRGAHVYDVYPTLLRLLGVAVPADADGRVLAELLRPAFRATQPALRVASWDGLPRPVPAAPGDRQRGQEELQKLRDLGYIR